MHNAFGAIVIVHHPENIIEWTMDSISLPNYCFMYVHIRLIGAIAAVLSDVWILFVARYKILVC